MCPVHAGIFEVVHHVVFDFHNRPASPAGTVKNAGGRKSPCCCLQDLQDLRDLQDLQDLQSLVPVSSPRSHTPRSHTRGRPTGSSIFQKPVVTLNPKVSPSICSLPHGGDLRRETLVIKPSTLQASPQPGLPARPRPASCTPDYSARRRSSY